MKRVQKWSSEMHGYTVWRQITGGVWGNRVAITLYGEQLWLTPVLLSQPLTLISPSKPKGFPTPGPALQRGEEFDVSTYLHLPPHPPKHTLFPPPSWLAIPKTQTTWLREVLSRMTFPSAYLHLLVSSFFQPYLFLYNLCLSNLYWTTSDYGSNKCHTTTICVCCSSQFELYNNSKSLYS